MSDKSSERVMSTIAEASMLLRQIAGYGEPGELLKSVWARVHRRLHGRMSFNRVVDLWREEPRAKVRADEIEMLRATARVKTEATNEMETLRRRIDALEAVLLAKDAEFYGPQVDALRRVALRDGGED